MGQHFLQFKKKDGTIRDMIATRDPALIPTDLFEKWTVPNPEKPRKESETSLPVYDIEADGFRSFSLDSLICVDGMTADQIITEYK